MDYENDYCMSYSLIRAIETLSDLIYVKCNENWDIFSGKISRNNAEELLAINYAIKLCIKELIELRNQ